MCGVSGRGLRRWRGGWGGKRTEGQSWVGLGRIWSEFEEARVYLGMLLHLRRDESQVEERVSKRRGRSDGSALFPEGRLACYVGRLQPGSKRTGPACGCGCACACTVKQFPLSWRFGKVCYLLLAFIPSALRGFTGDMEDKGNICLTATGRTFRFLVPSRRTISHYKYFVAS